MTHYSDIMAVILAGGLGTRLRTVVSDRPKALASVNGRPFLGYLLEQLAASGISRAVLCTGHLGQQIEAAFGTSYHGVSLSYSHETQPLGTAGALRLALPFMQTEQLLVLNGDSFCSLDHRDFYRFHQQKGAPLTLCLTQVPDVSRYGAVTLDPTGRILSFEEKGARQGLGSINAGIYLVQRSLIAALPEGTAVSLEKEVIPGALPAGVYGFSTQGRFIDIGVPADYQAAQQFFN